MLHWEQGAESETPGLLRDSHHTLPTHPWGSSANWARLSLSAALLMSWSSVLAAGVLDRSAEDALYREQLVALADKCGELGLTQQDKTSRDWFAPRDPRRHYLYLPPAVDPARVTQDAPQLLQSWYARLTELRRTRAQRLFDLARQQVERGDEGSAYRLLHEVLHEDIEHAEARRILGYTRGDRGWSRPFRRPSRRRTRGPHPLLGWADGQHWNIDSEHFELTTNLSVRGGQQVATYLERVYAVWQQLFYEYWSVPGRLAARFQGEDQPLGPDRTFAVVLFADRAEYLRQLSRSEPQIEMSVGYYSQSHKMAFFYAGDEATRTTWVHESTHQFFQESGTATPLVGERGNFWAVEGVALYMESLSDRDTFMTTGGADADRLQYARYRKLSEGIFVPIDDLVKLGRKQVQQDPNIRQLYSQCAGLSHYFLHADEERLWHPFINYLTAVYRGVGQPETLRTEVNRSYEQLEQGYRDFLNVTDADLAFVDKNIRNLCLGHTAITDAGLQHVRGCEQLRWLDLSFTEATDAGLACLADARLLEQLSLEKTRITDQGLGHLTQLRQLEELDLSQTSISDAALPKLSGLSRLKVLWLTGTQITDEGLPALSSLRKLEQLDTDGTRVTPAALEQLSKQLPNLK